MKNMAQLVTGETRTHRTDSLFTARFSLRSKQAPDHELVAGKTKLSGEDELKMMEENRDRLQTMSFSIEVWRRQRTMTGLSFWWLQRNWVDQEGAEKQKSSALEAQQQWLQNGGRSPLVFFTCAQRQRPGPNQNPQI
jgi:hypothetical protein